jgi:hypothetical protein
LASMMCYLACEQGPAEGVISQDPLLACTEHGQISDKLYDLPEPQLWPHDLHVAQHLSSRLQRLWGDKWCVWRGLSSTESKTYMVDDVKLSGDGETLSAMPSAPKRASVSCTRIRPRVDDNLLPGRVGLRQAWGLRRWLLNCHAGGLRCTDVYA